MRKIIRFVDQRQNVSAGRRSRRVLAVLVVGAVVLTGCQQVRSGTRCRAGAAPGRDTTHVLFCQGGKWKRVMTIGQAAEFILSTIPGRITATTPKAHVKAGDPLALAIGFRVTGRTGKDLPKAKVTLSAPATGVGLEAGVGLSGVTGDDGMVYFPEARVLNALGTFSMTATVDGSDVSVTSEVSVAAGELAAITVTGGSGQTVGVGAAFAPISARLTDARGNPVSGKKVGFYYLNTVSQRPQAVMTSDANGNIVTAFSTHHAPNRLGTLSMYLYEERSGVVTSLTHTIVAGRPNSIVGENSSSRLTAAATTAFAEPIVVTVLDAYSNPVPGVTVSFTVVPMAGADATLGAPTAVTGADGRASVAATAGAVAGDYQVTASVNGISQAIPMRNT